MNRNLKKTIYETVAKICDELGSELEISYEEDTKEIIGELVCKKLQQYGTDLEAFMKHAKRNTINVDDVRLLIRNNDSIKELIDEKYKGKASTSKQDANPKSKKRKINEVASDVETIEIN